MPSAYKQVGVLAPEEMASFGSALDILRRTFDFPRRGKPVTEFGLYASVLDIGRGLGLAVSTDGVGTKLLVAEEMGKYDTVGIDCVAMNANDILCVGAEPLAMVDYVAVRTAEGDQLRQIAIGLAEGARQARISIPGGETAQVREMLAEGKNDEAFDLVGTCVGLVDISKIIDGAAVEAGNALIGFASTGIHSNGLTLARRVFQSGRKVALEDRVPEFERTLGEELLEPSKIYVDVAMQLMAELDVRLLAHITSDGFLNLGRGGTKTGFDIEFLPPPLPIFEEIQARGEIPHTEMASVFNLGVGFCAVVPESDVERALAIAVELGHPAWQLGSATASPHHLIRVRPLGIEGVCGSHFVETAGAPSFTLSAPRPSRSVPRALAGKAS